MFLYGLLYEVEFQTVIKKKENIIILYSGFFFFSNLFTSENRLVLTSNMNKIV